MNKRRLIFYGVIALMILGIFSVFFITDNREQEVIKDEVLVTQSEEQYIDHPIVGTWSFYKDVNDMLNSEWTVEFFEDGTYVSESSPSTVEGIPPREDIYGCGTYTIENGAFGEELAYYYSKYQKTLNVGFKIEIVDEVESLTFYWGNEKISKGKWDGEEVFEIFVRE